MITKIGFNIDKKSFAQYNYINKQNDKDNSIAPPPNNKLSDFTTSQAYFVSFTANNKTHSDTKLDKILYNTDTPAKKLIEKLETEAKNTGYDRITTMHVIKHDLLELKKYIKDLDNGEKDFNTDEQPAIGKFLSTITTPLILSKPENRKKITPVIDKYIEEVDKILEKEKPQNVEANSPISFSQDLIDAIWTFRDAAEVEAVAPYTIVAGAVTSPDDITKEFTQNLVYDLSEELMINNKPIEERAPFSEYEAKAKNALKNLSLGTNIFVTYEPDKNSPESFLDTIQKVNAENPNSKIQIIEFNQLANVEHYQDVFSEISRDKDNEYILALSPMSMMINATDTEDVAAGKIYSAPEIISTVINQPSNVKFLFYGTKNQYYAFEENSVFGSFEEMTIPNLSTAQMIKSFKENPILMKDIQKPFSKKAVEKAVEASAQLDGAFPEKTQKLMKKIVSYYISKKEINENDVANYMKEATNLFKKNTDDTSIEIVFDTKKKMKDFVGKTATQKEATAIAKQIKSNKIGTKGIIIYSQDGSPGAGRKFTAKAIAGEAKVPYIEMNTMDFGTKEVDLFGGGALSPEASVKKLFSLVTAQAEANSHKSAVLFIENFEYFSVGEMVSYYHQKAMSQLLREMDKAEKAGLNILVVGSVSDPKLIGNAALKSFKFIDKMAVTSPGYSKEERAEVIKYAVKKEKIKIKGSSDEQNKIIDYVADISDGFPFIYIKNLVKKANSVAQERGHKILDKSDFTEAYLQISTGRPATTNTEEHEKKIVTSHECGHATNLEVMNILAKTKGEKWHIPNKVNFITLDPRGMYGGAVYHGDDINSEYTFERVFGSMVCSFGGNSAENQFYKIDGSIGISADMENVRYLSELMVKVMGLGKQTGKMTINPYDDLSDSLKTKIENDERVIINNAKIASDLITEIYADFNKEFTKKYSKLVGTGECIINGDDFRQMLNDWKARQTPEKQHELELCDDMLLKIMDCTKKGLAVRKED